MLSNKLKANLCVYVYVILECMISGEGWRCLSYSTTLMGRTTENNNYSWRKYSPQTYNEGEISNAMDLIENWSFEDQPEIIKYVEDQEVIKRKQHLTSDLMENWNFDENDETEEDRAYEKEYLESKTAQKSQEQEGKHDKTNYIKKSILHRYVLRE